MKLAFVVEDRTHIPVDRLCRILSVMSLGYQSRRGRPVSQHARGDMVVLPHIREQHHLSFGSYGRPRMTQELKEVGVSVGHHHVSRLMRDDCIQAVRTRKYKATTDSNHGFNIVPNLLARNFHADQPNRSETSCTL